MRIAPSACMIRVLIRRRVAIQVPEVRLGNKATRVLLGIEAKFGTNYTSTSILDIWIPCVM